MMKNILLVGDTGVGKSSITNLILGQNVAGVGVPNKVERGTFATEKHSYKDFCLFETIGYNDVSEKSPRVLALTNLEKFALEVKVEGISLIVYIMKRGRITTVSKKNYEYFVRSVCKSEVPVLLVVTHCEEDSDQDQGTWYSSHEKQFKNLGMTFADAVCGSAADLSNPNLDPEMVPIVTRKRARTQEALRRKIEELALSELWTLLEWGICTVI